jgi:hypothetical protein
MGRASHLARRAIGGRRLAPLRRGIRTLLLPRDARREATRDVREGLGADPGPERAIAEGLAWLARAQDRSASADGGVAGVFSLVSGWSASYPETTGYVVPTVIAAGTAEAHERARRMLDWLVSIQLPCGAFQGGLVTWTPVVPVTFNTGQILIGLASGAAHFGGAYVDAMRRAATWLVETQDADGCWRRHPSPFTSPGVKTYETHVAWGLFEAARVSGEQAFGEAGLANVRWALERQQRNGWFADCCLTDPSAPLTHTIGYALRGVLEAHRWSGDDALLAAARRSADGLLGALEADGHLPGRLLPGWRAAVPWACLTGSAQVAHCWLMLHHATGDVRYRTAARSALGYVRRTMRVDGRDDVRGGVKGSFPVSGAYCPYEYLNWACKFTIDACALELAAVV